jgi:elongation factor 1-beta
VFTGVLTAVLKAHRRRFYMGLLLARIKVLPTEADLDMNKVFESIQSNLPGEMIIKRRIEEPIAYGLVALVLDVQIPEKDGIMESLENAVRLSEFVSEIEVLGISKLSTKIG